MEESEFQALFERAVMLMFEKVAASIVGHGTVKSVDKTKDTCVIEREGEADMIDVRLRSVIDESKAKVVIYPKEKSHVLWVLIGNKATEAFIIGVGEAEEINIKIGSQTLVMNADETVLNGGDNGGMVNVGDMVGWMKKVYADLQTLKGSLSTWAVAGNGAPLGLAFVPTTPSPVEKDFEDKAITH